MSANLGVDFWRFAAPLLLLLTAAISWLVFSYGYIEDDAFIHLEFARSFSEGRGFSFNGLRVNGDTAPLWVVLLAAVHSLGVAWITAAKVLCGVGLAVALSGVWRIAGDLAANRTRHRYLGYSAILVTALNPYFVHWSFSGMESVTALGLSLWAIWAVFSATGRTWLRIGIAAILLSIAPLLRPELVLLVAVAAPALLFHAWQMIPNRSTAGRLSLVILLAVLMALPTLTWAWYAIDAFGSVIPNTNAAKRGGSLISVATRLASVYFLGYAPFLAVLPLVSKRLLKPGVPVVVWILLIWTLLCAAFYIADHTAVQTRYCLLSMPSLAIAVLWLLEDSAPPAWVRRVVATMILISVAILFAIVFPHVGNKVKLVKEVAAATLFIRDSLPPAAPVAVYSIGQYAFESRHALIDIGGITRPGVLPYLGNLPATIRWAKEMGAQYYIGGESPDASALRVFSYSEPFLGWSLRRSDYGTSTTTGIYRLTPSPP